MSKGNPLTYELLTDPASLDFSSIFDILSLGKAGSNSFLSSSINIVRAAAQQQPTSPTSPHSRHSILKYCIYSLGSPRNSSSNSRAKSSWYKIMKSYRFFGLFNALIARICMRVLYMIFVLTFRKMVIIKFSFFRCGYGFGTFLQTFSTFCLPSSSLHFRFCSFRFVGLIVLNNLETSNIGYAGLPDPPFRGFLCLIASKRSGQIS
jgi:hypothetical protein